jgi:hypothetical protein
MTGISYGAKYGLGRYKNKQPLAFSAGANNLILLPVYL